MPIEEHLSKRAQGAYPLSLSTSLAIESITGENKSKIKEYNELWVNISTLVRNIYTSLDLDTQNQLSDAELTNVALDEIEQIDSIVRESLKPLTVRYYLNDFSFLRERYREAKFRTNDTPKQRFYQALLENTYANIHDYFREEKRDKIEYYRVRIEPKIKTNAIFFTHAFIDLTNRPFFKDLILLESYTGKLKDRSEWYTKFKAQASSQIPPTLDMISIFGDSVVFYPLPKKYQTLVLDTASQYKWSCVTTQERIKLTLSFLKDRQAKEYLLKFIHSNNFL